MCGPFAPSSSPIQLKASSSPSTPTVNSADDCYTQKKEPKLSFRLGESACDFDNLLIDAHHGHVRRHNVHRDHDPNHVHSSEDTDAHNSHGRSSRDRSRNKPAVRLPQQARYNHNRPGGHNRAP